MIIKREENSRRWLYGQLMVNSRTTTKNKDSIYKKKPHRPSSVVTVVMEVAAG